MRGYWLFFAGMSLMLGWNYTAGAFMLFAAVSD